jgi:phosphoribosylglycinamide formyltransferase-1
LQCKGKNFLAYNANKNEKKVNKIAHFFFSCAFYNKKDMKKIAVFASGSGTNAENITRYFADSQDINVVLVVSNNPLAGVHARVNRLGIPSATFTTEKLDEGSEIVEKLREYEVDWIVLAGFLKKISATILNAYPERIVNIHPALLPRHGGKGMYGMRVHEAVVAAGDTESGITIHYVNENYDEGQIIFQARCPVSPSDTPEDVADKVHALEYRYYPEVVEALLFNIPSHTHPCGFRMRRNILCLRGRTVLPGSRHSCRRSRS